MTQNATICVGTLGQGIWRSSDGGDTWLRVRHGLYSESAVRALAVYPSDARIIYCGADSGVYRSEDSGEHWERLDSPMNEIPIWALAIDPVDPNIIFAGTRPAALFRSTELRVMTRGGKRSGAGRKRGSLSRKTRVIAERAAVDGITPLEVILRTM